MSYRVFLIPLVICFLTTTSHTTAAVTFKGGKGTSYQDAIIVVAKNEQEGVPSEYEYLRKHFPGWEIGDQTLSCKRKRCYDLMTIRKGSQFKTIYFDISRYFGKY
jgi:hypothetical protein